MEDGGRGGRRLGGARLPRHGRTWPAQRHTCKRVAWRTQRGGEQGWRRAILPHTRTSVRGAVGPSTCLQHCALHCASHAVVVHAQRAVHKGGLA